MITVFNRREAAVTFDMAEQARIRSVLADNGIEYVVKTVNRRSSSPLSAGTRARTGSFGEKPELQYQYTVFVKKEDLERAAGLIARR